MGARASGREGTILRSCPTSGLRLHVERYTASHSRPSRDIGSAKQMMLQLNKLLMLGMLVLFLTASAAYSQDNAVFAGFYKLGEPIEVDQAI